jgi:branched-chain amino acid transport system ATP-binding protein
MGRILETINLTMDFGGLRAIDGLDLRVDEGEIMALIGPNGAGKTTFFNCITGICPPTRGEVFLTAKSGVRHNVVGLKPNHITKHGMARTFQNIRLFPNMTVLENIMVAHHCRTSSRLIGAIFRNAFTINEEKLVIENSFNILKRFGLDSYVNEYAKNLPYGAQKRLEIARAMATGPFLLLLDEPAAGLNNKETRELIKMIMMIRDNDKVSILLIEHDMKLVMSISDRIAVLDYGRKIADASPEEIKNDPEVIKAYLGEEFVA